MYKDTLGKRDIVLNMIQNQATLAEVCKALGCTRQELEDYYGDLVELHHPLEYIPTDEDRKIVHRYAAYGMTQDDIALALGVSTWTLRQHFRRELDTALHDVIDKVATSLVAKALDGDVKAQSFFLARRAGWKETSVQEQTGKGGAPIQTVNLTMNTDVSTLNDDELTQLQTLLEKMNGSNSSEKAP